MNYQMKDLPTAQRFMASLSKYGYSYFLEFRPHHCIVYVVKPCCEIVDQLAIEAWEIES